MNFDQFIQLHALQLKQAVEGSGNGQLIDKLLESEGYEELKAEFKTVCAPISIPLFDRLNERLDMLGITKREFIQAAIVNALERVDQIVAEVRISENVRSTDVDA